MWRLQFRKGTPPSPGQVRLLELLGKWSMADVFVVAVFLAILSTNHASTESKQQLTIFAFKLDLLVSSETLSNAGVGFYYFTAYCLLSLLGTQLYMLGFKQTLVPIKTPKVEND